MSNSSGSSKLNFDDIVGLVLNEDVRRRANGESLSSALHIEAKRDLDRSTYEDRSKSRRGKSKSGGAWKVECWSCGKIGHLRRDCKASKKNGAGGSQDNGFSANVTAEDYQRDALILSLDSFEPWLVGSEVASVLASPRRDLD